MSSRADDPKLPGCTGGHAVRQRAASHHLAHTGSLSPRQNVTAAMCPEAANEVKQKKTKTKYRAWYLENKSIRFYCRRSARTGSSRRAKHQTGLRARKQGESSPCSALDACESLRDPSCFKVRVKRREVLRPQTRQMPAFYF